MNWGERSKSFREPSFNTKPYPVEITNISLRQESNEISIVPFGDVFNDEY
jgi:hypothetical protein